jgi:hypothetical protein
VLDQHGQATEEAKRVLSPLIINNRFADDKRPAFWQRGVRLGKQLAFLLQTPVVQDVTHNNYVGGRDRVLKKVAWIKAEPLSQPERLEIFLKSARRRADRSCRRRDVNRYKDVRETFVIGPRELKCERLGDAHAEAGET